MYVYVVVSLSPWRLIKRSSDVSNHHHALKVLIFYICCLELARPQYALLQRRNIQGHV